MSFLTPLSLALGLLAAPIIILYMLRLRRREVEVSSTLLWQMLLRDREANAPWQKLRRNLLLLLQLLLLAAVVIALARPFVQVPAVATGRIAVLLDASASMNATDVQPTRFAAAQAAARQIVDGLTGDSALTLIRVSGRPEALANATSDKALLREAIAAAAPTDGPVDWAAAFALAAGAVGGVGAFHSTVVVISDGGLPDDLPPLPGEVRYIPIGQGADNLAVSALALRPAAGGPQLFASVANYGEADRDVILSLMINGEFVFAEQLHVPASQGGDEPHPYADRVISDLPDGVALYQASLSLPPSGPSGESVDSLPTDDTAWAIYSPATAGRTLLISAGNIFLEQVLAALPGLEPYRTAADAPLPTDPFDLYVFDGTITDTLPAQPLLIVNPPATTPLLTVGGVFTEVTNIQAADDPLVQFVDFTGVHILQVREVEVPTWARVLVASDGGPLVLAGEIGGRRVAVVTFDLHDSDLPLQVAFPILFANLIHYLAPAEAFSAPDGLRPGQTLTIRPETGTAAVVIDTPRGRTFAAEPGEQGVIFADTDELGVYTVTLSTQQNLIGVDYFAVNLFDPSESNIRPRPVITVGRNAVSAAAREEMGQRELWPWLAGAAFGLLLLEWWVYHRGATLPAAAGWRGWVFRRRG